MPWWAGFLKNGYCFELNVDGLSFNHGSVFELGIRVTFAN